LATLGGADPRTQESSASTSSALAPSIERECGDEYEEWELEGKVRDDGGGVEGDETSERLFSLSASAARSASLVRSFSSCRLLISRASWSGSSVMSWWSFFFFF